MKTLPLQWKLALLPAAVLLGLMLLTLWLGGNLLEERLLAEAAGRAEQSANLLVRRLNRTLDRRVEELRLVAGMSELRVAAQEDSAQSALDRALRFSPYFVWLGLRNELGEMLYSTGEAPSSLPAVGTSSAASHTLRLSSIAPDPTFSSSLHQGPDELYLDIGLNVRSPGAGVANVSGRIAWRNIEVLRDDQRDDDPEGGLQRLVLIADGSLKMGDDVTPSWRRRVLDVAQGSEVGRRQGAGQVVGSGREALLLVAASLPLRASEVALPWRVYAIQDLAAVLAPVETLRRTALGGGVAASVCLGIAGYLLGRRIVRPYRPFLEAIARRVREQPAEAGQALTRHLDAISRELEESPQRSNLQAPVNDVLDQLVESAQRLGAVLEQVPAGVLLLSPLGMLVFSNKAANDILKLGRAHREAPFATAFQASGTRDQLTQVLSHASSGVTFHTLPIVLDDASVRWCQFRSARLTDGPRPFQGLLLVVQDVSDEVKAEEERLRYQDQLQHLTHQLLTQEKLTTARLAQPLHDQLGQTLAALNLCVEAALRPMGEGQGDHPATLARQLGAQAVREVRQVLIGLRPPLLDELGLVAALDNEVALQTQRHPEIDILAEQTCPPGQRWPQDVEYAAFMVAREALANALMHANATVVRVTLNASLDGLQLEVEDDGQGVAVALDTVVPGHYGLIGMRERAAAVGATFQIISTVNEGVVVRFSWHARTGRVDHPNTGDQQRAAFSNLSPEPYQGPAL